MIRVLQIVDNISIDSGVSSFLMNVYRSINKDLFQFDFLVASKRQNSFEKEIKELGGNVIYFGNPFSIKSVLRANSNAKRFIEASVSKYEVFHLHTPTMGFFSLRHVKNNGGSYRIIHSHSSMTSKNKIKAVINKVLNIFSLRYANAYFACSTEAADFLYGKTSEIRKKAVIVKNAVDPTTFSYNHELRKRIRKELNIGDEIVLAHISNFSPIKNTHFLDELITDLSYKSIKYKMLLIGDGPRCLSR